MSHTVVTTTSTAVTSAPDAGVCNIAYARSLQGLLKIGQVVTLLIAFVCVHCEVLWVDFSALRYFEVVTVFFLIVFLLFFLIHLLGLHSKMTCINWTLTEFVHYAVGGILIFIGSLITAVKSYGISGLVAGSTFGFIATLLIAINIWTSYQVTCGSQPAGVTV